MKKLVMVSFLFMAGVFGYSSTEQDDLNFRIHNMVRTHIERDKLNEEFPFLNPFRLHANVVDLKIKRDKLNEEFPFLNPFHTKNVVLEKLDPNGNPLQIIGPVVR